MSVKFAVLGHGVVGSGVVELFYKNKEKIEKKAGCEIELIGIDQKEYILKDNIAKIKDS